MDMMKNEKNKMNMINHIIRSITDMSEKQLKCLCFLVQALKEQEEK